MIIIIINIIIIIISSSSRSSSSSTFAFLLTANDFRSCSLRVASSSSSELSWLEQSGVWTFLWSASSTVCLKICSEMANKQETLHVIQWMVRCTQINHDKLRVCGERFFVVEISKRCKEKNGVWFSSPIILPNNYVEYCITKTFLFYLSQNWNLKKMMQSLNLRKLTSQQQ